MAIPASTIRIIEHIAHLDHGDLTAVGPVVLGTEGCRTILAALRDAETLRAVRALVDGGMVSAGTLRTLLTTSGTETVEIRGRVRV